MRIETKCGNNNELIDLTADKETPIIEITRIKNFNRIQLKAYPNYPEMSQIIKLVIRRLIMSLNGKTNLPVQKRIFKHYRYQI